MKSPYLVLRYYSNFHIATSGYTTEALARAGYQYWLDNIHSPDFPEYEQVELVKVLAVHVNES